MNEIQIAAAVVTFDLVTLQAMQMLRLPARNPALQHHGLCSLLHARRSSAEGRPAPIAVFAAHPSCNWPPRRTLELSGGCEGPPTCVAQEHRPGRRERPGRAAAATTPKSRAGLCRGQRVCPLAGPFQPWAGACGSSCWPAP